MVGFFLKSGYFPGDEAPLVFIMHRFVIRILDQGGTCKWSLSTMFMRRSEDFIRKQERVQKRGRWKLNSKALSHGEYSIGPHAIPGLPPVIEH